MTNYTPITKQVVGTFIEAFQADRIGLGELNQEMETDYYGTPCTVKIVKIDCELTLTTEKCTVQIKFKNGRIVYSSGIIVYELK